MTRAARLTTGWVTICAIVAVVLRWTGLGRESLWFDEGMTWWLASLPPAEMLRTIRGDVAAPVYFLLLRGWETIFGDSAAAMRAMSALAATLTLVPFGYITYRVLQSRLAIGAAWLLMAISFMQVQYAQEARYYALMALLAMTALACTVPLASRRSWGAIAGFVACVIVGLYTHNMMMFCLVGLNLAWLCWPGERSLRSRLIDLTIANGIVVVLYLPWVPTLLQQMKWMTGTFWATRPNLFDLGVTTSAITGVDVYAPPGLAWRWFGTGVTAGQVGTAVGVIVLGLLLIALSTRDAAHRRCVLAVAAFAIAPVVLVFLYSQVRQPIFMERVFIASSAAMPILLAMAIDHDRVRSLRWTASAMLSALLLLGAVSTAALSLESRKEDWRGAYATVAQLPPPPRRLIVFTANEGELPFAYYAAHDSSRPPEPRTGTPAGFFDLDPPKTIRRVTSDADLATLRAKMDSGNWDEIVLILSHEAFSDPDDRTERELRARWRLIEETPLRLVRVLRFAR
jgi:uncharacterized membrane protein